MFLIEELIHPATILDLEDLAGDLFSIQAEQYDNEFRFGWRSADEHFCEYCGIAFGSDVSEKQVYHDECYAEIVRGIIAENDDDDLPF